MINAQKQDWLNERAKYVFNASSIGRFISLFHPEGKLYQSCLFYKQDFNDNDILIDTQYSIFWDFILTKKQDILIQYLSFTNNNFYKFNDEVEYKVGSIDINLTPEKVVNIFNDIYLESKTSQAAEYGKILENPAKDLFIKNINDKGYNIAIVPNKEQIYASNDNLFAATPDFFITESDEPNLKMLLKEYGKIILEIKTTKSLNHPNKYIPQVRLQKELTRTSDQHTYPAIIFQVVRNPEWNPNNNVNPFLESQQNIITDDPYDKDDVNQSKFMEIANQTVKIFLSEVGKLEEQLKGKNLKKDVLLKPNLQINCDKNINKILSLSLQNVLDEFAKSNYKNKLDNQVENYKKFFKACFGDEGFYIKNDNFVIKKNPETTIYYNIKDVESELANLQKSLMQQNIIKKSLIQYCKNDKDLEIANDIIPEIEKKIQEIEKNIKLWSEKLKILLKSIDGETLNEEEWNKVTIPNKRTKPIIFEITEKY
jgi:hypothetical protein